MLSFAFPLTNGCEQLSTGSLPLQGPHQEAPASPTHPNEVPWMSSLTWAL